jgi:hypothetical protein
MILFLSSIFTGGHTDGERLVDFKESDPAAPSSDVWVGLVILIALFVWFVT